MPDLLGKWLRHYDPIHRGWTPVGIANGVSATSGFFFPRVAGGYNLYRGVGGLAAVDFSDPVGAASGAATSVRNFSWRGHASSTAYVYALRAVGAGGVEAMHDEAFAGVAFDAGGNWLGPLANAVVGLRVEALSGGRFAVRWGYDSANEGAAAESFRVYHDNGMGTVDFGTVLGTVTRRVGAVHHEFVTGAYGHGARVLFAVRSVTGGGVEELSTAAVMGVALADGPPVHGTVLSGCGEEK
jgi:hypothetical protein